MASSKKTTDSATKATKPKAAAKSAGSPKAAKPAAKPKATQSAKSAKPAAAPKAAQPAAKTTQTAAAAPKKAKPAAKASKPVAKASKPVAKASKPVAKASKPAKPAKPELRDTLTPEEKERVKKLRATLALLKEDPEWPAFLEEQKQLLHDLRDKLLPNMRDTTRDHLRSGASNVSSSSGQHIGDAGSEAEVRDLTINLLNKDREQLFEIDAALERIRRGTYGICEISLVPIPKGRLRVRPFCRLTVKCQEEYEKKYGSYANFKSKNSDHVGYSGLQNDMKNAISLDEGAE